MRIQRMMPGSAAYKEKTAQATTQTNMAYVLADVAESFAMDAMRNLATVAATRLGLSERERRPRYWGFRPQRSGGA